METSVNHSMCRCCASEGAFKDVKSTYHWMGEEEIYADMLRDCFDINLSMTEDGDDSGICEVCITQLRNAINFKKQVKHTEEHFKKLVQNKALFRTNIVKIEAAAEDDSEENVSADDGFSGPEYDVPIKTEEEEIKPKKRASTSKITTRSKKAKADSGETSTKSDLGIITIQIKEEICSEVSEPMENKNDLSDNESDEDDEIDNNQPGIPKTTPRTEIVKHRNNIREILLNSNATPIRKYGGIGYTCCYCEQQYPKPAELKKHTLECHKDVNKSNIMIKMNMSEYVVKLDVTDLKCNLCNELMNSLEEFINHLRILHKIEMHNDIRSHILPLKFDSETLHCVLCPNTFSKFRMLVRHMNKHFRNFICEICDSGFVNRNSLTQHSVNHKTGEYTCDFCPKKYSTQVKKRLHERSSHTHVGELNKCAYCEKTFNDYRKREEHLAEVHGRESTSAVCQACDKVFNNRRKLNIHVKRDHLLERSHNCTQCDKNFFSATGLKNHMVSHSKSREFQCKVCLKSYGRKKTLNAHMRVHEKTKLNCEICSMSFVQTWNLKAHMKSKHGEKN